MKRQHICAFLLAFAVLVSFLFSVTLPSARANHVHENEETCAICATIQECNELVRSLSTAVKSSENVTAPVVKTFVAGESKRRALSSRRATPVFLKVKLLN